MNIVSGGDGGGGGASGGHMVAALVVRWSLSRWRWWLVVVRW